jgi:hypothetical protein
MLTAGLNRMERTSAIPDGSGTSCRMPCCSAVSHKKDLARNGCVYLLCQPVVLFNEVVSVPDLVSVGYQLSAV